MSIGHDGRPADADAEAAVAAPTLRLRLLGSIELTGSPGAAALLAQPKRVALLAYLAAARPAGLHRRDRLVALFWPEHRQEHARAALRKAVYAVRQALGDGVLVARGDEELGINRAALWCDLDEFEDSLVGDRLARALELYRGDLLDGFFADAPGFERWLESARDHHRQQAANAAWMLAARYEAGSDLTSATRWARRAAALGAGDERMLRRSLTLLDRAGDRAGAVRVYDEFARWLSAEYGVEPSVETQALIKGIRGR